VRREALTTGFVDLSISILSEGVCTIVEVVGELDLRTVPRLRERLKDLVANGNYHLVVDLEGVDFLDSTGLGVASSTPGSVGCRGHGRLLAPVARRRDARLLLP
jgi:anti-anti-sigma factor